MRRKGQGYKLQTRGVQVSVPLLEGDKKRLLAVLEPHESMSDLARPAILAEVERREIAKGRRKDRRAKGKTGA